MFVCTPCKITFVDINEELNFSNLKKVLRYLFDSVVSIYLEHTMSFIRKSSQNVICSVVYQLDVNIIS